MTVSLPEIASHIDSLLRVRDIPDYPNAVNGVQVSHRGPVVKVASAVDASLRAIHSAIEAHANLLLVHHGLFWSGLQPITDHRYDRVRLLIEHDIALYSSHLPLDVDATFGNSRLLAGHLSLSPTAGFAHFEGVPCGVRGAADVATTSLLGRLDELARQHDGRAIASAIPVGHRTRQWAICSGAGAGTATLDEAAALGVDTLIVGEGPHWTAVDAPERGLVIIYVGHYVTETFGVRALGEHLSTTFGIAHEFVASPTGL